jgi:transcriptional regulator with PAS, ATPase and Fis domain
MAGTARDVKNVSIIDTNPHSCPAGYCDQLADLVQQSDPGRSMRIRLMDVQPLSPDTTRSSGSSTDLIVFRPALADSSEQLLPLLRARFRNASLFGLFCCGWEGQSGSIADVVGQLDDFLWCPFNTTDLSVRLQRLLGGRFEGKTSNTQSFKDKFQLQSLVGESECFVPVIEKVPLFAQSDAMILIHGETGTGKELFARAIHYTSSRRDKPFVPINCGALPDQLFENELFGHVKGAFTDAYSLEKGLLGLAEGGTVFLDEVDTLSLAAQVKLLRFLQDKEYRPLGSAKSLVADVRILAATNADLRHQVAVKLFRQDLYHRLNVLSLHIPPLRERIGDIPLLAHHLLAKYSPQDATSFCRLSPGAFQKLAAHSWPGNVRELESVIQRSVVLHPNSTLQACDIDLPLSVENDTSLSTRLQDAKSHAIGQFEQTFLANLLATHHGNISRAAKAAGKERRSFQRLLQKHGLSGATYRV